MVNQEELVKKYKLNQLNTILVGCEDEIDKKLKYKKIEERNDNLNFLLYTIGKSFVSAREVIILCWSGFPDGALSISRNIFEQFIAVAYIESKKEQLDFSRLIERYNDDYIVQRAKALKFEAINVNVNEEKRVKYDNEIHNIKKKYGIKDTDDYWWTLEPKMNFSKLCDYVANGNDGMKEFIRLMQLLYKRACLSIHASSIGNRIRIGNNTQCVDMGPWDKGQENALFLSTTALIYIVGSTFHEMDIKNDSAIRQLNDLAIYYHGLIKKRTKELKKQNQ